MRTQRCAAFAGSDPAGMARGVKPWPSTRRVGRCQLRRSRIVANGLYAESGPVRHGPSPDLAPTNRKRSLASLGRRSLTGAQPQVGLSTARRRTKVRISLLVGGRPRRRDGGWVQWWAMRWRCHRSMASGVMVQRVCSRWGSAALRSSAMTPSRDLYSSSRWGRLFWRRGTVSWWRNTMISRSLERPARTASRTRAAMRR